MTATPEEMLHREIREWMHEQGFDPESLDDLIYKDKFKEEFMSDKQRKEAQVFIARFHNLALDFTEVPEIDYNEFTEKYQPIKNEIDKNSAFNGWMFETYGRELAYINKIHRETPRKVWTIIDGDTQTWIATGFHIVNRIGYMITVNEWEQDINVNTEHRK